MKILFVAFAVPFLVAGINTPREKSENVWKNTLTKPGVISSEIMQKLTNVDLDNLALSSIDMRDTAIQYKPAYFAVKKQMAQVTAACNKDNNEANGILSELRLLTDFNQNDARKKSGSRTQACWKAISDLCKADSTRTILKGALAVSLLESGVVEHQLNFNEAFKACPVKIITKSADLEYFRHFPEMKRSVVSMTLGMDTSNERDFRNLEFSNLKSVKFISRSDNLVGLHGINAHDAEKRVQIPPGAIETFLRPGIEEIVFDGINISEEAKDLLEEKSSQLDSLKRLEILKGDLNILLWTKTQNIRAIVLARSENELLLDTFSKTSKRVEAMEKLERINWEYYSNDEESFMSCDGSIAFFSELESAGLKFPQNLKHLQISCFPRVNGMFKNLHNLKSLKMRFNVPIMDNDELPTSLERLQISNGFINGEIGWRNPLSRLLTSTNTKLKELDLHLSVTGNGDEVAGLVGTLIGQSSRLETFSFVIEMFQEDSSNVLEFDDVAASTEFKDVQVQGITLLLDEMKLNSNGVSLLTKYFSASLKLRSVELNIGYTYEIEKVFEALPLSLRYISVNLELARKSRALSSRLSAIRASTDERVIQTVLRN